MLKPFESFAKEALAFPLRDKVYTLAPYDIPTGIRLTAILAGQDEEFAKKPTWELYQLALGDIWQQLLDDGATLEFASRCGMTAIADFQFGRPYAEAMWEAGEDPKAISAYLVKNLPRAQRRSHNTAGANSTPSRASTKATTSRRK